MKLKLFDYIDYRMYLNDLFCSLQSMDSSFSLRAFARMAGSSSPNYLQLIRDRKLNISTEAVAALSVALGFSEKEQRYLETLVLFDHAKTHKEKDLHFRSMLKSREHRSIKKLEQRQYDYFSHWYYPVIRELVVHPSYSGNLQWIANKIVPQITVAKVKKGIEVLENLGLLKYNSDSGRFLQTDSVVSTPAEVLSVAVVRYHRDLLLLASEALDRFGPHLRDIRSVTLGVSEQGFEDLKEKLRLFWEELLVFSETQTDIKRVVQINIQAFPLSEDIGENDGR